MAGDKSVFSSYLPVSGTNRTSKPRTTGINLALSTYTGLQGMNMLQDLVSWAGDYIDYYKAGLEMRLRPREDVIKHVAFLKEHGIQPYAPGGVSGIAFQQKWLDQCLDELKEVGVRVFEASRIRLTMPQMLDVIQKGKEKGFTVFAEVGKKYIGEGGPETQTSTSDVIQEGKACLDAGAFKVLYENAELVDMAKKGEGMKGLKGEGMKKLREIADAVGPDDFMIEMPNFEWTQISRYAAVMVEYFGPNVNLGSVSANHIIGIEKIRQDFSAVSSIRTVRPPYWSNLP